VGFLRSDRFDKASDNGCINRFLARRNISRPASKTVGAFRYWFVMIVAIIASLDALGLPIVSDLLNPVFLYIPNVIAAVLSLIPGVISGKFISSVAQTAASNAGMTVAKELGKGCLCAMLIFAGSIALNQLGMGKEMVSSSMLLVLGAGALVLGLALGLAGKAPTGECTKRWFRKLKPAKLTGSE
jgi:hypothetical protein